MALSPQSANPDRTAAELPAACLRPGFFDPDGGAVELVETHISWVFLTATQAFKLKKPVRFEFLDFSTPAARREACEAEVRLNRRLAESVYEGVVPVTLDAGGALSLDGRGVPVDWIVRMRRLPEARRFDVLMRQDALTEADCRSVARHLCAFHRRLRPAVADPTAYRARLRAHVRANFAELARTEHALPPAVVRGVHAAQLSYLEMDRGAFAARVEAGRVVEGHGDLRPEHIYLTTPLAVIDCLEFSADLRTLDVADEMSFLTMECDRLGARDVGRQLAEAYDRESGQRPPARLIDFYKCYRACVRAKVAALRTSQAPLESASREAMSDLALAAQYAARLPAPPLIIVRGLSGSGKTTLASALSEALLAEHLQTDRLRLELFGSSGKEYAYGEGNYQPSSRDQVYEELLTRARQCLSERCPVVLDGTFLQAVWRDRAARLAAEVGVPAMTITCRCPDEVARQRIAQRATRSESASEVRPELLEQQKAAEERASLNPRTVEIDTTQSLEGQLAAVWRFLQRPSSEIDERATV